MALLEVNDGNFAAEVMESDIPVVVDFWGPGCRPCMALMPVLEGLSDDYAGKVKFVKVNVSENFGAAQDFGVEAIPVLLFVKDGNVVDRLIGSQPKQRIAAVIDEM